MCSTQEQDGQPKIGYVEMDTSQLVNEITSSFPKNQQAYPGLKT